MVTRFKELVLLFEKLHIFERKNSFFFNTFENVYNVSHIYTYLHYLIALIQTDTNSQFYFQIDLSPYSFYSIES